MHRSRLNTGCRDADNHDVKRTPCNIVARRRRSVWRRGAVCVAVSLWLVPRALPQPLERELPPERAVHIFNFDERDEGNLEPIPKFWVPIEAPTFPRFSRGEFDTRTGHEAPPAFRLHSEGRNVAYRYAGPDTRVTPNSDYLITGWIRGADLVHARAALSAYYLDGDHNSIAPTQRFSRLIGGKGNNNQWQRVEIYLPAGPPQARLIGLTAWVVQQDVWDGRPQPDWSIDRYDVDARAWFDDLAVHRLPKVTLEPAATGGVFDTGARIGFHVSVFDVDTTTLSAEIEVVDVEGRPVRTLDVPVRRPDEEADDLLDLGDVKQGSYEATLCVWSRGRVLVQRRCGFAVVGKESPPRLRTGHSFGVVLDPDRRAAPAVELSLLRRLGVGAVKLPVWSGSAQAPDLAKAVEGTDVLLHGLLKAGVAVTGVFAGPPSDVVQSAGAFHRSLLRLLDEDAAGWREHLVAVVAPYASVMQSWQIGRDDDPGIAGSPALARAIDRVRREMEQLTTAPSITAPGSFNLDPAGAPTNADRLSLTLNRAILPRFIETHLDAYRDSRTSVSSVFLEPTPIDGIDRLGRLRDWSKRLLYCRHAGVPTTFVPQPWHRRYTPTGVVIEPDAEFVILRAMIDAIGDGVPGQAVHIAPGVTALAFHDDDSTVLVMWDDRAGAEHRPYVVQLGSVEQQLDMWGRPAPVQRAVDGRHRVVLNHEPIYISGVERWLVAFRTLLSIAPPSLELSLESHEMSLTIANPHQVPLEGSVRIDAPAEWDVAPTILPFALAPGQTTAKRFQARIGRGETAGVKVVNAIVNVVTDREYTLNVPLPVTVGTGAIEAWGLAYIANDRLVVRHGVTNRSDDLLNLRAYAMAPGRARQSRMLGRFPAGRSSTLEYQFRNVGSLRGRTVRLQLRELDGPRIHNLDVLVD